MRVKETIIIASVANSCLLLVLFISAITSKSDVAIESTKNIIVKNENQKVLENIVQIDLQKDQKIISQNIKNNVLENIKEVANNQKITDEKVVYKLPEINKKIEEEKKVLNKIVVKSGDSLDKIAKRYHLSVAEIIKINELKSSFLRIGQVLMIPENFGKIVKNNTVKKTIQKKENVISGKIYKVKPGDNPYTIAMKHHMKVSELLKLNNLNEAKARRLRPGDKLKIR